MAVDTKKICFRTKGNHKQGMGDVIGSLALSEEFKSRGHIVNFIVDNDIEAIAVIKKFGYKVIMVKANNGNEVWNKRYFDVVIVNQLSTPWEQLSIIKQHCRKLVTIDDTGDASKKLADLRINPLYYAEGAYCGPSYISLHPVFQKVHEHKKAIRDNVEHILVTMGGSDTYGFTPQILEVLSTYPEEIKITVIIGPAFKHNRELKKVVSASMRGFDIFGDVNIKAMCQWIQWADVAICAGGNTLFEMACCGTPAIVICSEPFEEETAYRLEKMGFGKVISFNEQLDSVKLEDLLNRLHNRVIRESQSKAGTRLIDVMGARRIANKILEVMSN